MQNLEDIERNISEVKYLMEAYSELYSRIKSEFGENEGEFGDNHWKTLNSMNKCILDGKQKIKIIRQAEKDNELSKIEAEKERVLHNKEVETEKESQQKEESSKNYDKKISFIKYISDEIKSSTINLEKSYSISLKSLSDHQLFEKHRDFKESYRVSKRGTFTV